MPSKKLAPVVAGTMLVASLALTSAGTAAATENPATTSTDDIAGASHALASVTLVRGSERTVYDDLAAAFAAAQTGDVIEIAGEHILSAPIELSDGRMLTLRAVGAARIARGSGFPLSGSKIAGMVRLSGGSSLSLEAADPAAGELVLTGEDKDSDEAIITLNGGARLTMGAGTAIEHASCSWKPWAAVYVRGGSFVLDGGTLRDSFAMRNAAVAVEHGSSFEMRAGTIIGNRTSYSESIVWTKGSMRMTGGTIQSNRSNVSSDGVVHVLSDGELAFTGGTIGDNSPNNTFGVRVDAGAALKIGGTARLSGADRIDLAQGAALSFSSAPEAHTTDEPLKVVLSGTWDAGAPIASCASADVAQATLPRLSVNLGTTPERTASVNLDPADPSRLALASAETEALFELLDHPYADNLALSLRDELTQDGALADLRQHVEDHFGQADTPERRVRLQQLDALERYAAYLDANRSALEESVITLSELGDPGVEAQRTKQGYQFDNLDATGYYLQPGQVNRILVYVDAQDPSKLSVAWRQVGVTDTNHYTSLNLGQKSKLVNGVNEITVDLTGKTYASMLYLRNDSTDNDARVRIESADAADAGAEPILGSSLGEHPFYVHDTAHPERFWTYVQDIKAYARRAEAGEVADMTLLQMGDTGSAQFAISATAMARAYEGITSEDEAIAYIEHSNTAIQDRLEFYWAFDGFDADEESGPNAITTARVHTAFTRTVTDISTMYAYGRYFHMPESSAASFLSGQSMYGWGMSHEYGHMLDNNVIAVAEETNNLYALAGSRHGGIQASHEAGLAFDPASYYHVNAVNATRRRDDELKMMAADPAYVPDWMNGEVWGTYIWTHVTTWWNALHFFDDWDYSGYDFAASPYTEDIAADVERYGAYGATQRILRGDADAVKTIEDLASNAQRNVKYNRIAVAFTMGTGYNFAEYLHNLGEDDLAPEVLAWCAQYPSMPRKVQYFSIDTDAAIINGARTYAEIAGARGTVEPALEVESKNGETRASATMPTDELAKATTAWELYRGDQLIGFSRDGSFAVTAQEGDAEPGALSVVAYDVRLNPSTDFADTDDGAGGEEQPGGDEGENPGGEEPGGDEDPDGGGDEDPGKEDPDGDENPGEDNPGGDENPDEDEQPGEDGNPGGGGSGGSGDEDPGDGSDPGDPNGGAGSQSDGANGSDAEREPGADASGGLPASGDASTLPALVAAAGSGLSLLGAALARRLRRRER